MVHVRWTCGESKSESEFVEGLLYANYKIQNTGCLIAERQVIIEGELIKK